MRVRQQRVNPRRVKFQRDLLSGQIRRLLVVDAEGRLCGVVAQADVALSGRDRKTAELLRGVSEPKH